MPNQRLEYIDVARAFAILAVIVGHVAPVESLVHDICFTFELPLFFITSGYLTSPTKRLDRRFVSRSLRSIMLPYVVTCLIVIAVSALRGVVLTSEGVGSNVVRWTLASLYGAGDSFRSWPAILFGSIGAIWFLPALFFVRVTLVALNYLRHEWKKASAVIVLFVAGLMSRDYLWLPMSIQPAMVSLPFAYAGQLISRTGLLERRNVPGLAWAFLWGAFVALVLAGGHMYLNVAYFGDGIVVDFVGGVVGTLCVLGLSRWMCGVPSMLVPPLARLGRHTLAVFCMHLIDLDVGPLSIPAFSAMVPTAWPLRLLFRFVMVGVLCCCVYVVPALRKVYFN